MWVVAMVIRGVNKGYISKIYGQKQVKETDSVTKDTVTSGDSVDISSAAKEMQKLVQDTLSIDDVRLEKVEDLKQQIDAGQYHVPAKKLADALLRYVGWAR
jgi:negative regulator of flagellin synthesis FlgM